MSRNLTVCFGIIKHISFSYIRVTVLEDECKPNKLMQDKMFSCEFCSFTSKRKENVKKHEKVIHGNELMLFSNEYCPLTSKWKQSIMKHVKVLHGN